MTDPTPTATAAPRPVVFLPAHTLADLPTWLDDHETDDLLAAWTAAWHPRLVAAAGMPGWASVDLQPPAGPLLGIVPRTWDDRFAAQFDAAAAAESRFVRGVTGRHEIAAAALAAVGAPAAAPADRWTDDFQALGLAVLLAEQLARRMRTEADVSATGLPDMLAVAARAAVEGRDDDARAGLADCFRCLEASRSRYYPVDSWIVDLVLVAASTSAERLREELAAPVPLGIVAEPAALANRDADLARRIEAGGVTVCGGPLGERPLDACTPEELLAAFTAGAAAWERVAGRRPVVFARRTGGGSAILPQLLSGLGYTGAVWGTFDGARLPDPGSGRILWEGTGDAVIEALSRPPLDARSAAAVLGLPERIGDALDHDHVAAITFAHHAGTACEWHALVRRIGSWSGLLGTFVTPEELFQKTAGAGLRAAFGPDAFPPTPPPAAAGGDPLGAAVAAAAAAAGPIVARAAALGPLVALAATPAEPGAGPSPAGGFGRTLAGWWSGGRRRDDELVLESAAIRVQVHPDTGGILSLRRPGAGPNRLSQQLAPYQDGAHGRMVAERIDRAATASGAAGIVSRGRLVDAAGRDVGTFVQGLALVPGRPLVAVDVEVRMNGDAGGPLAEDHVACRFAWHENEDVELRRSVHAQAVVTERTRFTAPHFVEVVPAARRGAADEPVAILCGGLPWHVRSNTHVLDTILAGPVGVATRRLAVGVGVERPWDAALELLAGVPPGSGPRPGPANLRVALHEVGPHDGRGQRARVSLIESAGSAGDVRLEWAREVVAATAHELDGRPRPGTSIAIDGRGVVVFLRAHEWLVVDLEFAA
jgi:hypothetical protein